MKGRSRLDLLLVSQAAVSEEVLALQRADWVRMEITTGTQGRPGVKANTLVQGGFGRLEVARSDQLAFYSNKVGGFRVFCGSANITSVFVPAIEEWRSGGPMTVPCPACKIDHPLDQLNYRPPASFGRLVVTAYDVQYSAFAAEFESFMPHLSGPFELVYQRI